MGSQQQAGLWACGVEQCFPAREENRQVKRLLGAVSVPVRALRRLTPSGGCQRGCPDAVFKLYHDGEVAVNQKNAAKEEGNEQGRMFWAEEIA